ncbi:sigma factor-like helix-turn-helix DNA-binding protein [Leifsonia sp. Leaf264]|uniref:sigma factor-like helix-turn-helix DNA-binding protein n=1 Tax=Leifsonia sp. Leaf264 TaxID=1736314 RepID=UPI00138F25CA|nr:sigma factor-like helix-turn-helix DNA-binding protein [Leifsonia sp. Leaf264]
MADRQHVPLGTLYSNVYSGTLLRSLGLATRMMNALMREKRSTFESISEESVASIMDWSHVGELSILSLIESLTIESIRDVKGTTDVPRPMAEARPSVAPWVDATVSDFHLIAEWNLMLGRPNSSLLASDEYLNAPYEVAESLRRLSALTASELFPMGGSTPAIILQRQSEEMDPRMTAVLKRRSFADAPETYEGIAVDLGVSRERVRQLERKARRELVSLVMDGAMSSIAVTVRAQATGVLALDQLLRAIPSLREVVNTYEQPIWRILDRLDDRYEIADGWCAAPSIAAARGMTIQALRAAARGGVSVSAQHVIPVDTALSIVPGHKLDADLLPQWINYCGFSIVESLVLAGGAGTRGRAIAVLVSEGEPLSAESILDRLGEERSLVGLKNVLGSDSAFSRVNRDLWGLSEWEMSPYKPIRELIEDVLGTNDGSVSLSDLVDTLTSNFNVMATSVIAYAAAHPFVTEAGTVRRRPGDAGAPAKSPWLTRRLYRQPTAWVYRTVVTDEHLRGSGSVLPIAVAALTHLDRGGKVELRSSDGVQGISWKGIQPTLGSIKRLTAQLSLEAGRAVFFTFWDDGRFSVDEVREGNGVVDTVLAQVGCTWIASPREGVQALADALGLSGATGFDGIIARLRARREDDLAELLEGL